VRYSPGAKRITVGADKGFDAADFVVQNTTNRLSAGDTPTRHCGYEISQQKRKRVKLIPLMSSGWHAPPPIGAMPDLRATGPLSAEMLHWGLGRARALVVEAEGIPGVTSSLCTTVISTSRRRKVTAAAPVI
jgi:hypothetical protein